ncbi:hypothetical protein [Galbibacter mesophilus]|uniref:hypothetical protein n=1 Tax=Galbibacter mesophilus TaxID=379069 RepID=UPI00191DBF85|nr:hypothetical protein [Galbibacter mesophilus]MCM5664300.1 hypothetical protein [Galbibacter mesophilus]
MQLYKSRTFSTYISDTFAFLKENGKHFYRNYFIVNGVFLLILLVFTFIFSRIYGDLLFEDVTSSSYDNSSLTFASGNELLFVVFSLLFVLVAACIGIINYAYTPLYFTLYDKNNGSNFSKNELFSALKKNLGKFFIFILAGIIVAIPVFIVVFIAAAILIVTIIGIPLILIPLAWLAQFYFIAFIEYLQTDKGVFSCFSYSLNLSFTKFWSTNGSVAIFYFMIQVVQGIVTLIPYIVGLGSIFMVPTDEAMDSSSSTAFFTMIVVVYMVSFFLNLFLLTVLQMNQSIIFYSLKEETENIHSKSVIDEIGNH